MAREIDDAELIEFWTLVGGELEQVAGKRGPTRLGFALLLKFYTLHGRSLVAAASDAPGVFRAAL